MTSHNYYINTDGKAIVEFVLDSSWEAANNNAKYYYIGAEKDSWKSFLTDEFTSKMMLAYCEGDDLSSGVQVIGMNKYNPDHGDWYDPIHNPQVRGHYKGQQGINSDLIGWDTDRSRAIERRISSTTGKERIHHGLDIYAPIGTPVYAPIKGKSNGYHFKSDYRFKLLGKYKEDQFSISFQHLIKFEETKFFFYASKGKGTFYNYSDFEVGKEINPTIYGKKDERNLFFIKYNKKENKLIIDKTEIDLNYAKKLTTKFKEGKEVKKGDIIGFTGMTGNADQAKLTAHLHLYMKNLSKNKEVEPYKLLKDYIKNDEQGETFDKQDGLRPSSKWNK